MIVKSAVVILWASVMLVSTAGGPVFADSAGKRAAQSKLGVSYRHCLIEAAQHAYYNRRASIALSLEAADAVCMPNLRRFTAAYPGPISQQLRRAYLEAIYAALVKG
ncbi:exported hypothetical protein [Mesorhizobium metallidurans STM 2683]|uniref:Valyl-tRNA synthetase n=1 Tax=Mesorhizobium metallidurans STM 2683 TaxID=1297569 RepID=M5EGF8_9HYPH|nr:exported hypothetical protein [Mesorhizobium metallidurans STM 2683]